MGPYITSTEPVLSQRALHNVANRNEYFDAIIELMANTYNEITNPNGIVNLAIAESSLMQKIVYDYLNDKMHLQAKQLTYGDGPTGSVRLRGNLSRFINRFFHPIEEVKPQDIVVSSGVSGILDQLAWTLCNEGDGILVGKPVYSGFATDFHKRSRVVTVPVSFGDVDPFSVQALACYEKELRNYNAGGSGTKIRALLLANPHNPLGKCYPEETLLAFMRFCETHDIHLISDEIYAMSVFKTKSNRDAVEFKSVLSIDSTGIDSKRVHVLYGMSKDFSCNGFRLGLLISRNKLAIKAMADLNLFSWPSSAADLAWSVMLEDTGFLEYYLSEHPRRLGESYEFVTSILDQLGINYLRGGNSGFFVWVDLSCALEKPLDGEFGDEEDMRLAHKLMKSGVHMASGIGYLAEKRGWYRMTFTQPRKLVLIGLEKLMKMLKGPEFNLSKEISVDCWEELGNSKPY